MSLLYREIAFLLGLGLATTTLAQGRDPVIHIAVAVPQEDANGVLQFVPQAREQLGKLKDESRLKLAEEKSVPDVTLLLTGWYTASTTAQDGTTLTRFRFGGVLTARRYRQPMIGEGSNAPDALRQLIRGSVEKLDDDRGWLLRSRANWPDLGFEYRTLSDEERKQIKVKDGVVQVMAVVPDSAAATAGLHPADVVTRAANRRLKHAGELAEVLYETAPGANVSLEIFRASGRQTITFVLP